MTGDPKRKGREGREREVGHWSIRFGPIREVRWLDGDTSSRTKDRLGVGMVDSLTDAPLRMYNHLKSNCRRTGSR